MQKYRVWLFLEAICMNSSVLVYTHEAKENLELSEHIAKKMFHSNTNKFVQIYVKYYAVSIAWQ